MKRLSIEEFEGVIESYDEALVVDGAAPSAYGLIDTERKNLKRLGGSLPLMSTGISQSAIIDLHQLNFGTSLSLLVHSTGRRQWVDADDITPYVEPPIDGISEYGMRP